MRCVSKKVLALRKDFNLGIIGSCLSNIPAVWLVGDYGARRLNNAAIGPSSQFIERVIDGIDDLPPISEMQRLLDLSPTDSDDSLRYLMENYRAYSGLTEIDRTLPTIYENLCNAQFDLLLLDNLYDLQERRLIWEVAGRSLKFTFPMPLVGPKSSLHKEAQVTDLLTVERSIENWTRIIKFCQEKQPKARIIFSAAHSCTSRDDPERQKRAEDFYDGFKSVAKSLDVQLHPPISVGDDLMKLPDWAHFDMKVYKAVAGYIYTSIACGWAPQAAVAEVPEEQTILPTWVAAPSLRQIIAEALDLPESAIVEESGMDQTENWDSLKQVGLMTAVEAAFGVSASFDETMEANTVSAIREILALRGIVAADDVQRAENIFSRFVDRALRAPDHRYAKFVKGGMERELSFGWMLRTIDALAYRLEGLPPGAIVAIILDHNEHLYPAFVGSTLIGLVPTMLPPLTRKQDPDIFREAISVLFARVQPAAVVTAEHLCGLLPQGIEYHTILVDDLQPSSWDEAKTRFGRPPAPVERSDLAFLQHSSGTTGHKKGVMLSHGQVMEQARLYGASIGLETNDVICSWLPLYHDMGLLTSFVIPTIVGCPIISMDALEWVTRPTMMLDQIELERAAYAWQPNFAFHHMVKSDRGERVWDLSSLKAIISCSEPCRAASFNTFAERYGAMGCGLDKLATSYAMAENVFAVTQSRIGQAVEMAKELDSIYLSSGEPLPGVEIQIRRDGHVVADGELGDIWLRSTSMFSGYYKRPDLNEQRIVDGWYDTSDLGKMENGRLTVVGRTDDLIIISGKNVIAHELEDQLNGIPSLAAGRTLVASQFDETTSSNELIVLVEPEHGDIDSRSLEAAVRERVFTLCGVMPKRVRIMPKGFLVKSSSGKISRASSLEKFQRF